VLQAGNFGSRDKKLVLTIVDSVKLLCFESVTYDENCSGKILLLVKTADHWHVSITMEIVSSKNTKMWITV